MSKQSPTLSPSDCLPAEMVDAVKDYALIFGWSVADCYSEAVRNWLQATAIARYECMPEVKPRRRSSSRAVPSNLLTMTRARLQGLGVRW